MVIVVFKRLKILRVFWQKRPVEWFLKGKIYSGDAFHGLTEVSPQYRFSFTLPSSNILKLYQN